MKRITIFAAFIIFALFLTLNAQQAVKQSLGSPKTVVEKEAVKTAAEQEQTGETKKSTLGGAKKTLDKEPQTTQVSSVKPTVSGIVVSLNDIVMGQSGAVTPDQAKALADKGQPLALKAADGKVYMVINTDGSFATLKLSKMAAGGLGILGKVKTVNGVRVIIAEKYIQM